MKRRPIYYWIDHTARYAVQYRHATSDAIAVACAVSNGEDVVFVRWSSDRKSLVLATRDELLAFSRFNGPQLSEVTSRSIQGRATSVPLTEAPRFARGEGWLVVPEVTRITFHERPATLDAVLYGETPRLAVGVHVSRCDTPEARRLFGPAEAHAAYMQQIAVADAVLPISQFAAKDLVDYLMEFLSFDAYTMPAVRP